MAVLPKLNCRAPAAVQRQSGGETNLGKSVRLATWNNECPIRSTLWRCRCSFNCVTIYIYIYSIYFINWYWYIYIYININRSGSIYTYIYIYIHSIPTPPPPRAWFSNSTKPLPPREEGGRGACGPYDVSYMHAIKICIYIYIKIKKIWIDIYIYMWSMVNICIVYVIYMIYDIYIWYTYDK